MIPIEIGKLKEIAIKIEPFIYFLPIETCLILQLKFGLRLSKKRIFLFKKHDSKCDLLKMIKYASSEDPNPISLIFQRQTNHS